MLAYCYKEQNVSPEVSQDAARLCQHLARLVSEPFRFARVSYGDELTLHFGDLKHGSSSKMRSKLYGSYILGLRGSPWMLKSDSRGFLIDAGIAFGHESSEPPSGAEVISKDQLEREPPIEPGSRVVRTFVVPVVQTKSWGLVINFSDGSTLFVRPDEADAEEELADWELISPAGTLSTGPGLTWSFRLSDQTA